MFKKTLVGAVLLLAAGCANRFTYENYQTVEVGMSADQVEEILGKPSSSGADQWVYEGKERGVVTEAYITFDDENRVVEMEWPGDVPPEPEPKE